MLAWNNNGLKNDDDDDDDDDDDIYFYISECSYKILQNHKLLKFYFLFVFNLMIQCIYIFLVVANLIHTQTNKQDLLFQ